MRSPVGNRRRIDAQFVVAPSQVLDEVGLHLSAVGQGSHHLFVYGRSAAQLLAQGDAPRHPDRDPRVWSIFPAASWPSGGMTSWSPCRVGP